MNYKICLKAIRKVIKHINKSYFQLEKFYKDNNLESYLNDK